MQPAEAEAISRRLRLLCESDRLMGLKDWPICRSREIPCPASDPVVQEGPSAVARRANTSTKVASILPTPSATADRDASGKAASDDRLRELMQAFPAELAEPPGADQSGRPDPVFSARYTLKGSVVDVVKQKAEQLSRQAEEIKACHRCELYKVSKQPVFGIGHPDTRIVFVGEAPGGDEDRIGLPFVGRAGQLLTAMIEKGMGLRREHVYICNVVKHRPPENRTPTTDEMAACQEHMWRQLRVLEPEVVVALGLPAMQTLLERRGVSLGSVRGQVFEIRVAGTDLSKEITTKCVPTYHPAYLLRNPADKGKAWEDLKKVMGLMGIPARG